MKCYGVDIVDVCERIAARTNNGDWLRAVVMVGQLRQEIAPERAIRLYIDWGDHAKKEERKQHSAEMQFDKGCQCVVFRCLSFAKCRGLLESQGPPGAYREYRLTDKGRGLLKGRSKCQA